MNCIMGTDSPHLSQLAVALSACCCARVALGGEARSLFRECSRAGEPELAAIFWALSSSRRVLTGRDFAFLFELPLLVVELDEEGGGGGMEPGRLP